MELPVRAVKAKTRDLWNKIGFLKTQFGALPDKIGTSAFAYNLNLYQGHYQSTNQILENFA